jgi:hypothetical protein
MTNYIIILALLVTSANATDFTVEKKSKNSYNIYDWNTGNTYYGEHNGKRMMKIYPKTIVDSDNVLYPRSYEMRKGPYDGDPYGGGPYD